MRKNPRDKESGLPKGYVKGLSSSTAKARKAHWEKMSKLSDRDPRAYEPAPGDATAKTVPSKATREVRKIMNREEVEITEEAENSLSAKAKKFGVPLGTLKTVYRRGVAAWNSGHRPGTTPQQWGHARVNSYLRKGKGTYHGADKDLRESVIHSVHVRTYDSEGQKQLNSPEFKRHLAAQQGEMHYASDKGVAFKFKKDYHASAFHRGIQSHFKHLSSENDGEMREEWEVKRGTKVISTHKKKDDADVKAMKHPLNKVVAKEEVAVNAAGAGNVAGLGVGPQGEPGVHMKKKKKTVLASFKRFIGK